MAFREGAEPFKRLAYIAPVYAHVMGIRFQPKLFLCLTEVQLCFTNNSESRGKNFSLSSVLGQGECRNFLLIPGTTTD